MPSCALTGVRSAGWYHLEDGLIAYSANKSNIMTSSLYRHLSLFWFACYTIALDGSSGHETPDVSSACLESDQQELDFDQDSRSSRILTPQSTALEI